jgi:hypothetical protein
MKGLALYASFKRNEEFVKCSAEKKLGRYKERQNICIVGINSPDPTYSVLQTGCLNRCKSHSLAPETGCHLGSFSFICIFVAAVVAELRWTRRFSCADIFGAIVFPENERNL